MPSYILILCGSIEHLSCPECLHLFMPTGKIHKCYTFTKAAVAKEENAQDLLP